MSLEIEGYGPCFMCGNPAKFKMLGGNPVCLACIQSVKAAAAHIANFKAAADYANIERAQDDAVTTQEVDEALSTHGL